MFARALGGAALIAILGMPSTISAQERDSAAPSLKETLTSAFLTTRAAEEQGAAPLTLSRPSASLEMPGVANMTLRSLYVTTAAMQMLDMHSTVKAMTRGAVEANPLMSGLVQNRAAFVATKAGVAAATIFAANRLARTNKTAAIVTMVAMNSAYAMIVANNYRNASY